MPGNRGRMTTAPALVHGLVDTIHVKRNDSIMSLQGKMETTSQWLDNAFTSAKRKIVEGTGISFQDVQKKAKTFATDTSSGSKIPVKQVQVLSPIRDKENSPYSNNNDSNNTSFDGSSPQPRKVFVKPPPSAVKRKVNSMRVVDLRKELKSKGLETKGLKKDLQQRILKAYTTVETIMSPQKDASSPPVVPSEASHNKPSPTTNLGGQVEKENTVTVATTPVPEDLSEQNSADVIIPGSPSAVDDIDDGNMEAKVGAPQSTNEEMPMGALKEDTNTKSNDEGDDSVRAVSTDEEVMTAPNNISKSPRRSSAISMDIEPVGRTASDANDRKASDKARISLMDCDPSEKFASNAPASSSSLKEIGSVMASPPTEKVIQASEDVEALSTTGEKDAAPQKPETPEPSPELCQESLPKTKSNSESAKELSKVSSNSSLLPKAGKPAKTEAHKDVAKTCNQPVKQSPIKKRVQAAIQMLTAASNRSPAKTQPTATTPSKLAWLIKHQTKVPEQPRSEKPEAAVAEPVAGNHSQNNFSSAKQQVQQKAEKLAAAARRPGTGLASSATTTAISSSALKTSSRYLAGKPNSALSSSAQATNEARKARLAEIRGKSKPVSKPTSFAAKTFSATKDFTSSSLSALKAKAATTEDSKRKLLTAQMREKAARKQMEAKEAPLNSAGSVTVTAGKAQAIAKQAASAVIHSSTSFSAPKEEFSNKSPEQSIVKAAKAAFTPDSLSALRPQLLSPLDTYEISDREDNENENDSESESESEEEDENNARKRIPEWAQRANLIPALEKQFAQGNGKFDPDEIFPEVETCDLQAIFNIKKSRYIRRTSSGNWTRDRVTPGEKLTYKRTMGYAESKTR